MTFSQNIIADLQRRFYIAFDIVNYVNEDKFSITFLGDDANSVIMDILIKSDSRLKISIHTGNYAVEILKIMSCSTESRKQLFVKTWEQIDQKLYCKTQLLIGGNVLNYKEFVSYSHSWGAFIFNFESFPFYDPDDDNRIEVVSSYVCDLWALLLSIIPYTIEGKEEGATYEKTITKHERNPINRQLCIQLKGYACAVCGLVFEDMYGPIGHHFIEVHHSNPVAEKDGNTKVDVLEELFPLCSNCHSMAHRRKPPYSIKELKSYIQQQKERKCILQSTTRDLFENSVNNSFSHLENNESLLVAAEDEFFVFDRDNLEIAAETISHDTILFGCYKNEEHHKWVLGNHLYNVRLGKRDGSVDKISGQVRQAKKLVLFEKDNIENYKVYHLLDVAQMQKTELLRFGYPSTEVNDNKYLVFTLGEEIYNIGLDTIAIEEKIKTLKPHYHRNMPFLIVK